MLKFAVWGISTLPSHYCTPGALAVCERDCRTSLSLAESGIVGKSKNRRRTADGFEVIVLCLKIIFKFNKFAVLRGNKQKMAEICGGTVGTRPRGLSCFLLAGDPEGNVRYTGRGVGMRPN
jgi:hypothetical protein